MSGRTFLYRKLRLDFAFTNNGLKNNDQYMFISTSYVLQELF